MKYKIIPVMLCLCCIPGVHQVAEPPRTAPELSVKDIRTVAEINKLQQRIDRLESEAVSHQARIADLAKGISASACATVPILNPTPLKIQSLNLAIIFLNAGSRGNGLRVGDRMIFARNTVDGLLLTGKGTVTRTYPDNAECELMETSTRGVQVEDIVYVSGRSGTPYSIMRANLRPERQ